MKTTLLLLVTLVVMSCQQGNEKSNSQIPSPIAIGAKPDFTKTHIDPRNKKQSGQISKQGLSAVHPPT